MTFTHELSSLLVDLPFFLLRGDFYVERGCVRKIFFELSVYLMVPNRRLLTVNGLLKSGQGLERCRMMLCYCAVAL